VTTAVGKWPASARLVAGRCGGPLIHSSYTTTGDTTRRWAKLLVPDNSKADDKAQVAVAAAHGLTLVTLNWKDVHGRGVSVLNPGRDPPKLYDP